MSRSLLVSAGLQVGAVVLGHFWGVAVGAPGDPPTICTACALLAGLLILGDVVASLVLFSVEKARERNRASVWSLLYLVGLVLWEPFLFVETIAGGVVAAFVLVPLLLAIRRLLQRRAWVSLAGVTLFVLTSSAMLVSNANGARSGFFTYWRS